MSVIVLNQSIVHYESIGRGRPVVFLHTWVGSWRYWVPSLQVAAVSHSAYAIDLFGFGDSARVPQGYSAESQVALLAAFLDEMGMGRIALVGHGLGALVGLQFAASHLERIARVLVTGLAGESAAVQTSLLALAPQQLLDVLDARSLFSDELLPETRGIDPRAMRLLPNGPEIRRCLTALETAASPVLIVNGRNDPLRASPELGLVDGLGQHQHAIEMPESGHFPMLDAPDGFHRLLVDFLALEDGTSPSALQLKDEWRRTMR